MFVGSTYVRSGMIFSVPTTVNLLPYEASVESEGETAAYAAAQAACRRGLHVRVRGRLVCCFVLLSSLLGEIEPLKDGRHAGGRHPSWRGCFCGS